MNFDDLTEPLAEGLKESVRKILTEATDAELTKFTVEVATRALRLAELPEGEAKDQLVKENRGTLKVIAERHRIDLAEDTNEQLSKALDVGLAILGRIVAGI